MRTDLLDSRDESAIRRALDLLHAGELVAFPTDTVYGVGADATNVKAVEQLFVAKVRPPNKPIALLVAPEMDLRSIASEVPVGVGELGRRFWPGGLTIILRRSAAVPDAVTVGSPTVGVRVPNHPVALRLLREFGRPLATTSANLSGRTSPTTAIEVFDQLEGRIPLVLDGGRCQGGVESTVLDLTTPVPLVRRSGAISREALEETLGRQVDLA